MRSATGSQPPENRSRPPKYGRMFSWRLANDRLCAGQRNLWLAVGGEQQRLAFEDQVCIPDSRVRLRDAGPVGGVTKLGLRDF